MKTEYKYRFTFNLLFLAALIAVFVAAFIGVINDGSFFLEEIVALILFGLCVGMLGFFLIFMLLSIVSGRPVITIDQEHFTIRNGFTNKEISLAMIQMIQIRKSFPIGKMMFITYKTEHKRLKSYRLINQYNGTLEEMMSIVQDILKQPGYNRTVEPIKVPNKANRK